MSETRFFVRLLQQKSLFARSCKNVCKDLFRKPWNSLYKTRIHCKEFYCKTCCKKLQRLSCKAGLWDQSNRLCNVLVRLLQRKSLHDFRRILARVVPRALEFTLQNENSLQGIFSQEMLREYCKDFLARFLARLLQQKSLQDHARILTRMFQRTLEFTV